MLIKLKIKYDKLINYNNEDLINQLIDRLIIYLIIIHFCYSTCIYNRNDKYY